MKLIQALHSLPTNQANTCVLYPSPPLFFMSQALEKVAVSTPRDLVRLGAFPDVLIGAVKDQLGTEHFAPLESRITTQAVEEWRREGDRLLEQRPWLELWVHEG